MTIETRIARIEITIRLVNNNKKKEKKLKHLYN